jgi:hypothetical protein
MNSLPIILRRKLRHNFGISDQNEELIADKEVDLYQRIWDHIISSGKLDRGRELYGIGDDYLDLS